MVRGAAEFNEIMRLGAAAADHLFTVAAFVRTRLSSKATANQRISPDKVTRALTSAATVNTYATDG